MIVPVWIVPVVGVLGLGAGYVARHFVGSAKARGAEADARAILKEAKRDADATRKEAKIQAKAEVLKAKEDFES